MSRYCEYCEYPTHRADDCPYEADEIQRIIDEELIAKELEQREEDSTS